MSPAAISAGRVLYICHGHPRARPGGAEAYALELYESMRELGPYEPILVARAEPPPDALAEGAGAGLRCGIDGDPDQCLLYTQVGDWDWLFGTSREKATIARRLRDLLAARRPDVVHLQHTLLIGYDAIRMIADTLPGVPIVHTLHEFLPICHRGGQLRRTGTEEPCLEESPQRCHECFPAIAPEEFFLRKRVIQSHLSRVDMFLAPSRFLAQRYLDWGIPREKLRFEDYGRRPVSERAPARDCERHDRFAFFGQLAPHKGVTVLLEAIVRLRARGGGARLRLHGANLELAPQAFQDELRSLLRACGDGVELAGPYPQAALPSLMGEVDWVVVPSLWWENSPLVIQEAFLHGRPVICSDIGGMAEKVADGVNGLHFRAGDPESLSRAIERAAGSARLWRRLRAGIPRVPLMDEHVRRLAALYDELRLQRPRSGRPGAGAARPGA